MRFGRRNPGPITGNSLDGDISMKTNGMVVRNCFALASIIVLMASARLLPADELQPPEPTFVAPAPLYDELAEDGYQYVFIERVPSWFTAIEMTCLAADIRTGGVANLSFDDSGTVGTDVTLRGARGVNDFGFAPRIVVGRSFGPDWGIQARYWHLTEQANRNPERPDVPQLPTFGTYYDQGRAEMFAIDLEGIRTFRTGAWTIDATLGLRHGYMRADGTMHAFGVVTTGNFVNIILASGSDTRGTGYTASLMGRRAFNDSPFSLYLGGRVSQVFGENDSYGRSAGTVASSPSAPLVGAATVSRNNAVGHITIGEMQAGFQYERPIYDSPLNFFFRAGVEYQHWVAEGPPVGGAGFGGTIGDLTTNSFASANLSSAQLIGVTFGTGLTW
ncbi:hypothetical protein NA78x_002981 [Anatilimnocola sp. NA78]|uniref:hypothetical protein n=1 Tax=Anatilimnocola sp. NA78 TaxID=3415683 RepID=UPI003CE5AD15